MDEGRSKLNLKQLKKNYETLSMLHLPTIT